MVLSQVQTWALISFLFCFLGSPESPSKNVYLPCGRSCVLRPGRETHGEGERVQLAEHPSKPPECIHVSDYRQKNSPAEPSPNRRIVGKCRGGCLSATEFCGKLHSKRRLKWWLSRTWTQVSQTLMYIYYHCVCSWVGGGKESGDIWTPLKMDCIWHEWILRHFASYFRGKETHTRRIQSTLKVFVLVDIAVLVSERTGANGQNLSLLMLFLGECHVYVFIDFMWNYQASNWC